MTEPRCTCPTVWHGIIPPPCAVHNPPAPGLKDAIDRRRKPEFMERLSRRIEEDANILRRLNDAPTVRPCPSEAVAVLGSAEGYSWLRCGLSEGHAGPHTFTMSWGVTEMDTARWPKREAQR